MTPVTSLAQAGRASVEEEEEDLEDEDDVEEEPDDAADIDEASGDPTGDAD